MKILVGVDSEGTYRSALMLCRALRFQNPHWLMAHAVQSRTSMPLLVPAHLSDSQASGARQESGREALRSAMEVVGNDPVDQYFRDGNATEILMGLADQAAVDLVVVGAGHPKNGLLWAIGRVARALAYGSRQSLLVTKEPHFFEGAIRAVFATDGSEYANRALDRLLEWAPAGLKHIDVVTAYQVEHSPLDIFQDSEEGDLKFKNWQHEQSLSIASRAAERLRAIVPEVSAMAVEGETNEVLRTVMTDRKADLLIVGAQGHGFIERLLVGSVSLHQAAAEAYPVLLIRHSG